LCCFYFQIKELAVPTVLGGLALSNDTEIIAGIYVWVGNRDKMANKTASDFTHSIKTLAFEKLALLDRLHFAHPIKINKMDNKRYCQVMIQKIWIGDSLEDLRKEYENLLNNQKRKIST